MVRNPQLMRATVWGLALVCAASAGCVTCEPSVEVCDTGLPRELRKTAQPPYTVEPPDILLIDALRVIPLPPYKVAPLDALVITVSNAFPTAPINGLYVVDPDGTVNLGPPYKARTVSVVGKTLPEAKTAIEDALKQDIVKPEVDVSLGQAVRWNKSGVSTSCARTARSA